MQALLPDEEAAEYLDLVTLDVDELDVGDDVADARPGLLAPVDAGVELAYAAGQSCLAFVEPGDLRLRVAVGAGPVAELHVAADRHVVVDIVSNELDPVVELV